jgi:photosystem I subunit 3
MSFLKKYLTLIATIAILNLPLIASAEVSGLVKCSDSASFAKRRDIAISKLQTRIKKYDEGSQPALALQQQIERTKERFDRYSKSGLLCGKDGLPHLVADGDWKHANEFMIPGLMFLYTTGWIGWVGRKYVRTVKESANPSEKEIIIDVPLALKIMSSGYLWPISAWQEFTSGDLVATKDEVTVSPR